MPMNMELKGPVVPKVNTFAFGYVKVLRYSGSVRGVSSEGEKAVFQNNE